MAVKADKPGKPDTKVEVAVVAAPALDWRGLRLWQIQPIRDALVLVGIVGLIYIGYLCSIVTVPMLLALMLAYLFEPAIAWVTRRYRWVSRQGAAVAIIVLAVVLVVVPVTVGLGFAVVQGTSLVGTVARNTGLVVTSVRAETPQERAEASARLPRSLQDVGRWLSELRTEVEAFRALRGEQASPPPSAPVPPPGAPIEGSTLVPVPDPALAIPEADAERAAVQPLAPERVARRDRDFPEWKVRLYEGLEWTIGWVQHNAQALAKHVGEQALGTGVVAFGAVVAGVTKIGFLVFTAFLTAFFFYFFSTSYGAVLDFWEDLIPERKRHRVIDLVRQMDRVVAGFVRGRITICFILAVYMTIAYWLIGVPTPLVLGPAIGLLFVVPFVHVIGVPIAIVLMAIEPGGGMGWQQQWWWIVFAPVAVYVGAQLLDDWLLSPLIQGKTTGMDTPTILFASFAGGALGGVYGLLLAIPVAACIRILLKEVFWPRFRAWGKGKERDFLPIGRE